MPRLPASWTGPRRTRRHQKLAVSAAAAAGRQDALDQILGSWRNLSQAIATDLFLQMHRHTRPDATPPSGDALGRAAAATATRRASQPAR